MTCSGGGVRKKRNTIGNASCLKVCVLNMIKVQAVTKISMHACEEGCEKQ